MATLRVESTLPELTQAHGLEGWRREFCIELLGEGDGRVFVRRVEQGSLRADELRRATLFHRLDPRFNDLTGCIQSIQDDLKLLAESGRRTIPNKENLFAAVAYDGAVWLRIQQGIDRWTRR